MPRRKRKHIPIIQLLASALADMLPAAERDALRAAKVPAIKIVRMFTPDHNILHAWGGPDKWFNLTMKRRGKALKKKDNEDTSRVAKAIRVNEKHEEFRSRLLAPVKRPARANGKPKHKIPVRANGFPPKGSRKLQSRGFERRPA
jgi:hypothetical protein